MDYQKLSIVLIVVIVVILLVFSADKIKSVMSGDDSGGTDDDFGEESDLDEIFGEPSDDFEPPVLPG